MGESAIVTVKEPSVTVGVVGDATSKDVATRSMKFTKVRNPYEKQSVVAPAVVPLLEAEVVCLPVKAPLQMLMWVMPC